MDGFAESEKSASEIGFGFVKSNTALGTYNNAPIKGFIKY